MLIVGGAAVVSGGASGLGEAVVRKLVASGAHVVIVDVADERGQALVRELGERALFVPGSPRDRERLPQRRKHPAGRRSSHGASLGSGRSSTIHEDDDRARRTSSRTITLTITLTILADVDDLDPVYDGPAPARVRP